MDNTAKAVVTSNLLSGCHARWTAIEYTVELSAPSTLSNSGIYHTIM